MQLKVGVKIILKNSEGKYLLLCRSIKKYPEVGPKWDIPGGRIDAGSTLLENVKREVMEETSLTISSDPKLIAAQDIIREEFHTVRLTYTGEADGKVVLSDEHSEFKWVTLDEFKRIEPLDSLVAELIEKIK